MDRYVIRQALLNAVTGFLPRMTGIVLDVGCGDMPYRQLILGEAPRITGYLGMDIPGDTYGRPGLYWDGSSMPLSAGSVDTVLATEVLEHCAHPEIVLSEVARIMKPGGTLALSTPFLWPLHDVPHDEFRYTPFALRRLLQDAGFVQIDIRPLGGWDASMAQMIGLWVIRRPMSPWKRSIITRLAMPLMRWLLARDCLPCFEHSPMITGLSVTACRAANPSCSKGGR